MRRLRENFNEPGTLFQLARLGVVGLILGGLGVSGAAGNGAATRWVGGALVAASLVLLAVAIHRLRR